MRKASTYINFILLSMAYAGASVLGLVALRFLAEAVWEFLSIGVSFL